MALSLFTPRPGLAERAIAIKSGDLGSEGMLPGPTCVKDLQVWPVRQANEFFGSSLYTCDILKARASSFFSAGRLETAPGDKRQVM